MQTGAAMRQIVAMGEWVAVDATTDRRAHAMRLQRAHDRMASGGVPDRRLLRPVICRSWERAAAAGVDPTVGRAPLLLDQETVETRLARHPLAIAAPVLRSLLTDDFRFVQEAS